MTLRFAFRRAHARATDRAAAAVAVGAIAAAAGRSTAAIMVLVVHGERRSTLERASSGRWRVVSLCEDGGKNLLGVLLRAFASGARRGTGRHGDGTARRKDLDFGGNGLGRRAGGDLGGDKSFSR